MLEIYVPTSELFNDQTGEFESNKGQLLQLEHSLISLSKWEAKWCKPFLDKKPKTAEETIDYVRCMTLNKNVDPKVYNHLTKENIEDVGKYIDAPMTATWFNDKTNRVSRETVTSELIYYWMVALQIPFECQKWHLNRLLTLIKVCSIKNEPAKKMPKKAAMSQQKALNAARRAQSGSKG